LIRKLRKIFGWRAQAKNTNSCCKSFFPQYVFLLPWRSNRERKVLMNIRQLREGGAMQPPLLQKENQEIKKPVEETGFPVKPKFR
jgi:hypothetical protein